MERARMGSFWWPYISNLPQRFTLPIFFSREEIAALQYAPVIHQVKKRCRALLDLAAVVHSATGKLPTEHKPFGSEQVDANALGWAMAAVSSRAFCLHRLEGALEESVGRNHMLLPLVDMCNHSFSPNARIVQQKGKLASIMVLSEQDLEPGTPIFLSYGPLNNDILLLDYGFVVPQNTNDCIELRYDGLLLEAARVTAGLRSAAFSCPAPWQQIILQQLNLQGVGASLQVTVGGPDLVDGRLLAALRALFAEVPEELQKTDLNALQSWSSVAPLGLTNESNVLKTLVAMCAIALGHFPTTLAEDEKTLADKGLTEAMRLAVQFRMAKKQVLVDAMRRFTRKLSQLGIVESSKIYER